MTASQIVAILRMAVFSFPEGQHRVEIEYRAMTPHGKLR
jgi:hypothetical protein